MSGRADPVARSDYMKAWYRQHREAELARLKRHRDARRDFLDGVKLTLGCADCGYREHACALDFDHVSGDKEDNVGWLRSKASWARLIAEIDKCEVVCANCHRVRTQQRRPQTEAPSPEAYQHEVVWHARKAS